MATRLIRGGTILVGFFAVGIAPSPRLFFFFLCVFGTSLFKGATRGGYLASAIWLVCTAPRLIKPEIDLSVFGGVRVASRSSYFRAEKNKKKCDFLLIGGKV